MKIKEDDLWRFTRKKGVQVIFFSQKAGYIIFKCDNLPFQ